MDYERDVQINFEIFVAGMGGCSGVVMIVLDVRDSECVVMNAQTCEHAAGKNRTTSACGLSSDVHAEHFAKVPMSRYLSAVWNNPLEC